LTFKEKPMRRRAVTVAGALAVQLILCALLMVSAALAADGIEKTPHVVPKVTGAFKVDANLDEPFWRDALALELKYETRPGNNTPALVRTEVLLAYNDSYLLAAFRAYDPDPSRIRAHVCDRDKMGDDDWVGLIIDSFNDKRRNFDFLVNPLGVQADCIESSGDNGNDSWDAIWESAGRITDSGYVVEAAIPFSSLRFQRVDGPQVWNFDAVRSYKRGVDYRFTLFPRDRNNNCYLCQADQLVGFAGATPGKNVELSPTFTSLYSEDKPDFPAGGFHESNRANDVGLNARWGVTPNLMLNTTVNPDFSQVEADAAQLDINTNVALYYTEKRPFFLEGAELFNTRMDAVYTRTLADPRWGVKLTGKEGKSAIGFYTVEDETTNLLFAGSQGSRSTTLDARSVGTVFRFRRDVLSSSNVGVLATSREGEGYYSRLAGFDALYQCTKKDRLQVQALGSRTQYPEGTAARYSQPAGRLDGAAVDLFYLHNTETWDWYANYTEKTPDFRADLGYMPRVGSRYGEAGWGHTWNGDATKWYTMFNVGSGFDVSRAHDGSLLEKMANYWINYTGPMQSEVDLTGNLFGTLGYNGREFPWSSANLYVGLRPRGWLSLNFSGRAGSNVDYANTRAATSWRLDPWIELKLGRHFDLGLDHTYERLDVDEGRLYTANVSQGQLVYQFNRRTFLRAIVQRVDYARNVGLYSLEVPSDDQRVFSQFLFSYKINPQTVLYLGYSDNYMGYDGVDLAQKDRTLFAKIGYAWVL
jgi:hypothetical protein